MHRFQFRCSECGATYDEHDVRLVCPACARRQEPGGVTRGVLEVELTPVPEGFRFASRLARRLSGVSSPREDTSGGTGL